MEEFVDIVGYEGLYKVNRKGEILSLNYLGKGYARILKNKPNSQGRYYAVCLNKNGEQKTVLVHRLVAQAFIPNPNNLPQINHKDEDGHNNNVDNLEWCNAKYNMNYGTRKKRHDDKVKKEVTQCDLNGNFIKKWDCISDAEEFFGKRNQCNISKCCRGKLKSAYGFLWHY